MKLASINIAAGILSGVKINRIADKDSKDALLRDYLALRRVCKEADAEKDEIIRKFQEDWADELGEVQAFRDRKAAVVGHDAYLEAEKDANKAIQGIFSEDVDIDLIPAKMDAILGVSDDITLEQLAFLRDCGIIE